MFKLLACFSCFPLLLHVSTAYFYDSTTNEAVEIYQMRLQVENVVDMEVDESGCIELENFPAGDSKSKFKLGVCPKKLNEETKLSEGFVLVLYSTGNTPTNMAYYVYDLYVLGSDFEQTGRYTVRSASEHYLCDSGETCSEFELMFPESQIEYYLNSNGGIVIHVEILMLKKCNPCLSQPNQIDIKASKCSIDSTGLKTCEENEPYVDFPKDTWKPCDQVLTEMKDTKKACEDAGHLSDECLGIKDIVTTIQQVLSTEAERSMKSGEFALTVITDVKNQTAYAVAHKPKEDPCPMLGGRMDDLKKDLGTGVEKTGKQLQEISGGVSKFKDDYVKTEAARPKHPCYALEKEVNSIRTDFTNGLSKSDEQMISISSEITTFTKEYTDEEAARFKIPCEEFQSEISTFNNKYADEVKKTDPRITGIQQDIKKFRNDIITIFKGCDLERINMLEKSFSDKFNDVKSSNEKSVGKFDSFLKEENGKLEEEIAKFEKDKAAADTIRANERKLEEEKRKRNEIIIRQLKSYIYVKDKQLEDLKEHCKI